jgi:hypothetical protein
VRARIQHQEGTVGTFATSITIPVHVSIMSTTITVAGSHKDPEDFVFYGETLHTHLSARTVIDSQRAALEAFNFDKTQ